MINGVSTYMEVLEAGWSPGTYVYMEVLEAGWSPGAYVYMEVLEAGWSPGVYWFQEAGPDLLLSGVLSILGGHERRR